MRATRSLLLVTLAAITACGEQSLIPDAAPPDAPAISACSDNMDNDGDGKVDFPYDPGCSAPNEDSEADMCPDGAGCPQCADGIDNDNNGKIDFPDDPGCAKASDPIEFTDDPNACGQGLVINPLPQNGSASGMLTGTTSSVSSPCGGGNGLPAVAYVFHLTKPRVVVASTDDSATAIDTVLDLRSSMCTMPDAELACHDDINPGSSSTANTNSKLIRSLPPGTYYLIVGGKTAADTGMYSLNVTFLAGEGSACGATDDCGPGLVCRIPVGETAMVCTGPVCNDGRDDDADGIMDYPNDPGCATPDDDTEDDTCATNPLDPGCPECSNGLDDNGNGDIDYPNESNCLAAGSTSESCVQAESVAKITQSVTTGTTIGAVNDYKPSCNTSNTAPDVVYRLDVPVKLATLQLEIDGFDAVHALLGSTCENPSIACSDPDLMTRTNVAAGTYYVVVDGWSSNSGNFTLTTSGTIAGGESCEGELVQAGVFTCTAGYTCGGTPGARTCVPVACNDGADNDGDGKIDFPNDPGCASPAGNNEADDCFPTVGPNCPVCSDGLDNDGDGQTDYPADTTCKNAASINEQCAQAEPVATIAQAVTMGTTAGATNDYTPACGSSSHSAPDLAYRLEVPQMATLNLEVTGFDTAHVLLNSTCGGSEIACSDPALMARTNVAAGVYYVVVDGWGSSSGPFTLTTSGTVAPGGSCEGALFQAGAFTCTSGYACNGAVGSRTCTIATCNDGVDNDGDGKADAADPGCVTASDNDEADDCSPTPGPNCPACSDGVDNDGDGKLDFPTDTGCLRPSSDTEACAISEAIVVATMPQVSGTTVGATNDYRPPGGSVNGHLCSTSTNSSATAPDVTIQLDVPTMDTLSLTLSPVSYDSTHVLLDSTCGGTPIECYDNPTGMNLTNIAGGTYYLMVDGYSSGSGTFTLNISGTIKAGESCESPLAQSGAIACPTNYPCSGTPGMRRCLGTAVCSDGMDNDGDGKTDYPFDPGCTSVNDTDESDTCFPTAGPDCPQCGNGIDDDLDMKTDFPADSSCPDASFFHENFCKKDVVTDMLGLIVAPTTNDTLAGRKDNFDQSCQSNTGNDVTYGLRLPVDVAKLEIDTLGSPQDTVLSLWDGACSAEIECDDDGAGALKSRIKRSNVAAGIYAIQVDTYNASANNTNFTLNVKGTVAPGTVCTDPLFTSGVLVCQSGTTCTAGICQ